MNDQKQEDAFYELIAPLAPPRALSEFKEKCASFDLDPMKGEIGLYQGDQGEWFTLIRRDGFRKIVMSDPQYEYHYFIPEYNGDVFRYEGGRLSYVSSSEKAPIVVGAWGVVKLKNRAVETVFHANMANYAKNTRMWNSMPEIMICKVAETSAIRLALGPIFSHVYDESEFDHIAPPTVEPTSRKASRASESRDELMLYIRGNMDYAIELISDVGIGDMTLDELKTLKADIEKVKKLEGDENDQEINDRGI